MNEVLSAQTALSGMKEANCANPMGTAPNKSWYSNKIDRGNPICCKVISNHSFSPGLPSSGDAGQPRSWPPAEAKDGSNQVNKSSKHVRTRNSQSRGLRSSRSIQRRNQARSHRRRLARSLIRRAKHLTQTITCPLRGQDRHHVINSTQQRRINTCCNSPNRMQKVRIRDLAQALMSRNKTWSSELAHPVYESLAHSPPQPTSPALPGEAQ